MRSPVVTCGCVWLQWVCTNEYCDRRPLVPMKIGVMFERHPRSDYAGVTVGVAVGVGVTVGVGVSVGVTVGDSFVSLVA